MHLDSDGQTRQLWHNCSCTDRSQNNHRQMTVLTKKPFGDDCSFKYRNRNTLFTPCMRLFRAYVYRFGIQRKGGKKVTVLRLNEIKPFGHILLLQSCTDEFKFHFQKVEASLSNASQFAENVTWVDLEMYTHKSDAFEGCGRFVLSLWQG